RHAPMTGEDANRRGFNQLEAMATNSEVIVSAHLNLTAIPERVTVRARGLTGADFAAFSTFGDEGLVERLISTAMSDETARMRGAPPVRRGLLGDLVRHERPSRLDDMRTHEMFTGWPERHPDMRAFLGVPLRAGNETIGALYMPRSAGREPFTWDDE